MIIKNSFFAFLLTALSGSKLISVNAERKIMRRHRKHNDYYSPLPKTYINMEDLPDSFFWGNVNGTSYLTRSLNQHIPQYCGSCWAHAAMSSLSDRIKISRGAENIGPDINLSIQFILNCGSEVAGSCHGGSATGAFEVIKTMGFVPYETCQPYLACSSDSTEGFCPSIDTTCSPMNVCRTCTNPSHGGTCNEISPFPNATIAEYGMYRNDIVGIFTEIFARGPVTAGIAGAPIDEYSGGIISDISLADLHPTHEVSIVGWGMEPASGVKYWIVRNSWGDYWGELSFFRCVSDGIYIALVSSMLWSFYKIEKSTVSYESFPFILQFSHLYGNRVEIGKNLLGIESEVSWARPGTYTSHNFPCSENGSNCRVRTDVYTDPSYDKIAIGRKLQPMN